MILYFTGTGNSRYVAERVAEVIGDELLDMTERVKHSDTSTVKAERLVFEESVLAVEAVVAVDVEDLEDSENCREMDRRYRIYRWKAGLVHHGLRRRDRRRGEV